MTNRTTLTAVLSVVLALVGTAFAQPGSEPGAQPPCAACPGMDAGDPTGAMEPPPRLSAEQLQKMDSLRVGHLREVLPLQTDLEVKQIEIEALWNADELNANKILAKVREMNDARGRLQLARVNHRLAMYRLLTREQRGLARLYLGTGHGRGMRGMGRGMQGRGMMRGMGGMRGMGMGPGTMGQGACMGGQCQMGQGMMCPTCPGQGARPPQSSPEPD
jgi:Spy/CpxP family protein refolding chaperone